VNIHRQKWAALALVTVMAGWLLSACGGESTPVPTAGQSSAATTQAGATTSGATQGATSGSLTDLNLLIYAAYDESGGPPADWPVYQTIKDKLGINLKLNFLPNGTDGDTKLSALAASNSLPDLMNFTSNNRNLFFKFVDQGLMGTTDSLLPMMPQRTKDRYSDPNLNKLVTVNGKLYGLQEAATAQLYKRYAIVIRQDWLDKLGLKAPTTLDEFLNVAKAFTNNDPDGDGKNDTYGFGAYIQGDGYNLGTYLDFIYGAYGVAGTWNFSDLSNPRLNVRDPNYQKATDYVRQLIAAKVLDPDWTSLTQDDFRSRWKQGKYGMFVEDFCAVSCQANFQAFDTSFPNANLKYIAPPAGPDGKVTMSTYIGAGNIFYGVSQKALDSGKGPAIAKLLEWSNSGDGYYLLGFGDKGVNYNLDAKGNVVPDGIDPNKYFLAKAEQPNTQMKNLAYNGSQSELSARYAAFTTKSGRTQTPLDWYNFAFNLPYVDATPTQIIKPAANSADLSRYISEGLIQFVLGQKPLTDDNWKAYVQGLDGLGAKDWEASAKQDLQKAGYSK
jgi:putative aldouronate transport system substrate-binding protein